MTTSNNNIAKRLIHCMLAGSAMLLLTTATLPSVYAAQPVTNYEYDANGNLTKITDGLTHATTQQYDAVDRLIQQSQPHPTSTGQLGTIGTQYNAIDDVTGVTDPRSLSTTYTKNAYGEILTQVSPDTGTTTNTYDNAGNLKTRTDARGAVATYTYDALNRVTQITYKPSAAGAVDETITYTYDAGTNGKGRLTSMTDLSGGTTWTYDALGRVIRKQQRVGTQIYDMQTQYDTAGRVSRIIYPSTRYVDYAYNTNGQVNQISVDGNVMISNIQYHATGSVKSWSWGNAQSYVRNIDTDGRPISMTLGSNQLIVTYDAAGRITQLHRAALATPNTPVAGTVSTYTYDNLDRLTNNVTPTANQSYQYDLSGNRTQLTIGASNYASGIASTSNQLNSEAGPTARTYTYDTAGNITGNGQDTYTYHSSGRLKQVTRASTNIYALRYNGLGQFVSRTNDSARYTYDQAGHLLGEYNSAGDVIQESVWLGDTPVMTLRPGNLQRTADNYSSAATANAVRTGTWPVVGSPNGYYGSDFFYHAATASTTDKVTYTITPTTNQSFRVYARWVAQTTNATNATYTINTNVPGSTPATVVANQRINGGTWNYLGSYTLNTANNLTVAISGQGDGIVIADAVRIVPEAPSSVQNITYFIQNDHLNTPRVIRNYANQTVWHWLPENSEPFGANVPNENPSGLGTFTYNLRFPGQLYNPASGLSYNYFRDYNPRTGRYIESDPIGLGGGINTYGYVGGDPLRNIDPTGHIIWTGTYHTRSLIEGVGASWTTYQLTSECKNGRRAKIDVTFVGSGAGIGVPKAPPIGTETYGNIAFNDHLPQINPDAFNGLAGDIGASAQIGSLGVSVNRTRLGNAASMGTGGDQTGGIDVGSQVVMGSSTVMKVVWEDCGCATK